MKTKLLALLLCLLLVASACLMTACGGKKSSTNSEAAEVTDDQAREVALAGFMKGVEALRKGGITFTGTLKGTSVEKDESGAPKTETIDLTLALNYNNEKFDAVASGTAGGESGNFEIYFDGELVGMISVGPDEAADGDVYFLEDLSKMVPAAAAIAEDGDYSAILDQIIALIDLDKVAANINAATKGIVVIKTNGKTYSVTVTSDAIFDAVTNVLNILKDSGDKKVSELIDELAGEGTFNSIKTALEKYEGTDTLDTVLPDLEAALTDAGIKVDALYEVAAQFLGVEADETASAGAQVKTMLTGMLSNMTINDAISMLMTKFGGDNYGYGEAETYQTEEPVAVGEEEGEGDDDMPGMTYEACVAMILAYADMKVNDVFAMMDDEDDVAEEDKEPFDIATEVAPALAYVAAFKEAIKFSVTVSCDKQLTPTAIELTASIDTTKLPEDMQDEGESTQIELSISASIQSSVEVAPSTAMQAQIAAAKSAREAADEGEEEE